jgi:hypothetical protein
MQMTDVDPSQLTLHELRELRAQLRQREDEISYVRRLAQARLDLVVGVAQRRGEHATSTTTEVLADLHSQLGNHLSGGPARPPRPAMDASSSELALEFEELCARLGIDAVDELDDAELEQLRAQLDHFEHERSHERRELFGRIDQLSAELVRRYRDGEADVDGLLAGD